MIDATLLKPVDPGGDLAEVRKGNRRVTTEQKPRTIWKVELDGILYVPARGVEYAMGAAGVALAWVHPIVAEARVVGLIPSRVVWDEPPVEP